MPSSAATPSLMVHLADRIAREGPLRFPDFMAAALYHPEWGYYAKDVRQVGRAGDFFTSVSVGPLFGELLARRFLRHWRDAGSPARWRIIECGAHDGTLARDVLVGVEQLAPEAAAALEYAIPEPLPRLRAAQRETLARFGRQVRFVEDCRELAEDPLPGVAFGNELLDALPFHVVERHDGNWRECRVARASDQLVWDLDPAISQAPLSAALEALGSAFTDGYRTEVRTRYQEFFAPLLASLSSGILIWPDYGFARPEYYHPDRNRGTLRTFSRHQE